MTENQANDILGELVKTRESFEKVVSTIKWNRFNTAVLYVLMAIVIVLGGAFVWNYTNDRQIDCRRDNALRIAVIDSNEANAVAIGAAIASVSNASTEQFEEYVEVYRSQKQPADLNPREC